MIGQQVHGVGAITDVWAMVAANRPGDVWRRWRGWEGTKRTKVHTWRDMTTPRNEFRGFLWERAHSYGLRSQGGRAIFMGGGGPPVMTIS